MKKILLLLLVICVGYLGFWPVSIEPVAWQPPAAPALAGRYAENTLLKQAQRVAQGQGVGPEEVIVGPDGHLYTGYQDGRIVRFDPHGEQPETVINTGGRPFGLAFDQAGELVIADGYRGLLKLNRAGELVQLSNSAAGVPFRFTNNLAIASDGQIYFSDASSKFGPAGKARDDVIEHGGNGRLLRYNPHDNSTEVLLDGLQFANGVALAPDEQSVLVAETGNYRIVRYWLAGPYRGSSEIFIDNLPGLPDNLSSNGQDIYWLALFAPRNALLDAMAPYPWLRKIAFRLPQMLQPQPKAHAFVLGLSLDGEVRYNLQDSGKDSYHPITGAVEANGKLYLGSLEQDAIAVFDLSTTINHETD